MEHSCNKECIVDSKLLLIGVSNRNKHLGETDPQTLQIINDYGAAAFPYPVFCAQSHVVLQHYLKVWLFYHFIFHRGNRFTCENVSLHGNITRRASRTTEGERLFHSYHFGLYAPVAPTHLEHSLKSKSLFLGNKDFRPPPMDGQACKNRIAQRSLIQAAVKLDVA
ncbi:hypothetical protein J6590_013843 [Homalodisca vitripennis]|nr:hypothetical protein J6590_013843 [Homalodisca vitripennis]